MGSKFKDSKWIKESTLVVKFNDSGVILSDLNLAAVVLCCIDGADCERAIIDEHNPSRFLFQITGNVDEIKEFVEAWFSGKKEYIKEKQKQRAEQLHQFTTKQSILKLLIDKARVKIIDERNKE